MHKDCIILCGVQDQYAANSTPKCLELINGEPFLKYITAHLSKFHICKVVFALGANSQAIKDYILARKREFGFAFDFAESPEPLGTGGAILNSLQYSDTPDVLIMDSERFFNINLDDLIAWQQTKMGDVTIGLKYKEKFDSFDDKVQLDEKNHVNAFPEASENPQGLLNSGVYCMFRHSFMNIKFPKEFSFEDDYLKKYYNERDFIGMISDDYYINLKEENGLEKAGLKFKELFAEKAEDQNV